MTEPTLDEQVNEIVGPCPGCGSKATEFFTLEEKKQIVDEDGKLKDSPGLRRTIRKMGEKIWCTNCVREAEFKGREAMDKKRIDTLTRHTYRDELIPGIGLGMTFDKSRSESEQQNQSAWDQYGDGKRLERNVWFTGPEGTGKTWLSRCILNSQLAIGRSCAEIGAMQINDFGRGWNPSKDLKPYEKAKVLLIEDIDKVTWSPQGLAALWNLIDSRATHKKQLIITSNLKPGEVSAQMKSASKTNISLVKSLFDRFLPITKHEMVGDSMRKNEDDGNLGAGLKSDGLREVHEEPKHDGLGKGDDDHAETGRSDIQRKEHAEDGSLRDEQRPRGDEGQTSDIGTDVRTGDEGSGDLF